MCYEKTRQDQEIQMDGAVTASSDGFTRPHDHPHDGLRGRICRRINELERQLAEVKRDLSVLNASPIIEAAADLNAKYAKY